MKYFMTWAVAGSEISANNFDVAFFQNVADVICA